MERFALLNDSFLAGPVEDVSESGFIGLELLVPSSSSHQLQCFRRNRSRGVQAGFAPFLGGRLNIQAYVAVLEKTGN